MTKQIKFKPLDFEGLNKILIDNKPIGLADNFFKTASLYTPRKLTEKEFHERRKI